MKLNSKLVKNTVAVIELLVMAATSAAAQDLSAQGSVSSSLARSTRASHNVLASEWSNWLAAGPIATNPAFDPDGGFCDRNQAGTCGSWRAPSGCRGPDLRNPRRQGDLPVPGRSVP